MIDDELARLATTAFYFIFHVRCPCQLPLPLPKLAPSLTQCQLAMSRRHFHRGTVRCESLRDRHDVEDELGIYFIPAHSDTALTLRSHGTPRAAHNLRYAAEQ